MTGSWLFGRVNDPPHRGRHGFYRHRHETTETRRIPVAAGATRSRAHGLKNPIHWQHCACGIAGLLLILMITGCRQTNETRGPQPGQTPAPAEFTGVRQPAATQLQERPFAPDEVLVKFKPEADASAIAEIRTELKLQTIQKFTSPNLFLMKITDGASVETVIKQLNTFDAVKYAEPNYGVKTTQ